jgi:hypothetical protein
MTSTEINPTTGLPAIVAFRETLDGYLVVATYDECRLSEYDYIQAHRFGLVSDSWVIHERAWAEYGRPTFLVHIPGKRKPRKFFYRDEFWKFMDEVPLQNASDLTT